MHCQKKSHFGKTINIALNFNIIIIIIITSLISSNLHIIISGLCLATGNPDVKFVLTVLFRSLTALPKVKNHKMP